jgi:hypothetical protein
MGTSIESAVLEPVEDEWIGVRPPIHKNTVMFVSFENRQEAHFLCAVLNTSIVTFVARAYSVKGGKSFGSANLSQFIAVPQFDAENPIHTRLAALSQQAHQLAAAQTSEVSETSEVSRRLAEVEAQVDEAAAELWGITDRELKEIRRSLEELG